MLEKAQMLIEDNEIDIAATKPTALFLAAEAARNANIIQENIEAKRIRIEQSQRLIEALTSENTNSTNAQIKSALQSRADVNIRDQRGNPPLIFAAESGNKAAVQLLLQAKADVNRANDLGKAPIGIAVHAQNIDVLKMLIKAKADVNQQHGLFFPILVAVTTGQVEIVEELLESKADVNQQDGVGYTPLNIALLFPVGPVLVDCLLRYGANVNRLVIGDNSKALHPTILAAEKLIPLLEANNPKEREEISEGVATIHLLLNATGPVKFVEMYEKNVNKHTKATKLLLMAASCNEDTGWQKALKKYNESPVENKHNGQPDRRF